MNTSTETVPLEQNKKADITVYIYNVVEDEWSFINAINDAKERQEYIDSGNNAADAYYLPTAGEDNFLYISPLPISPSFTEYASGLLGDKNNKVLVPQKDTNLICTVLINDTQTLNQFISIANAYRRIVLISYAATPQLYELRDVLQKKGLQVYMPEAPEIENSWTVNFFGSKSGIRQLAQKSVAQEPDFIMSDGVICVGINDAAKIAANKYIKEKGVVIKTNKGSSGDGVLIFREGELPATYFECEKEIRKYLSKDSYWEKFPIIIEGLININYAVGNGNPNVEFKIMKNGNIDLLYYCVCAVTPKGAYQGIDIGEDLMNERILARIIDTGFYIAEKYSSAGYRGHFDVDMLAAKNNQIYVCETNTRNTGGTDIYKLAVKLFGEDFIEDIYLIHRSHLKLNTQQQTTLEKIRENLKSVEFNVNTKEGVIINSELRLRNRELVYTIYGKTKKRAYEIEEQMKQLLVKL